jgi:hypothetical protein
MNDNKRQRKQADKAQGRAIAKRANNDITVPIVAQPDYQVPAEDEALRASQSASWDTAAEIKILRFYLAKNAKEGINPLFAVQLTKAIDTMIARNQATALKCGAYLSREAITDFIKVLITISCEAVRKHAPELYDVIIDDMKSQLEPYFSAEAIAKANERHEK